MAARYPLATALAQREQLQEAAKLRLAEARSAVERAEAELSAANTAWSELARKRSGLLAQRSAVSGPNGEPRTGADLARDGRYSARLGNQLGEFAIRVRKAQATLAERARWLRLAELNLASAYAQRELVERHHARFQQAAHRAREHAQELETEELQQRTSRS